MNDSTQSTCPKCGSPIAADAPQGLCPKCVLGAAATAPDATPPHRGRTPPPTVEEIAAHFPELEVLELIGAGGMRAVYKARQRKLDRSVALKILSSDLAEDPAFAERFHREARVLTRLNHPHIVSVFDFGTQGPYWYLLLEYVDGVNLREGMQAGGFTPGDCLALAEAGATVLVWKGLPQDVPGWHDHAERKQRLTELLAAFSQHAPGVQTVGKGKLAIGDDLQQLLDIARIAREPLVDYGLQFIRRKSPRGASYFIANHTAEPVRGWVGLASPCRSALLMDPMTGRTGVAPLRGGEEMGLAPSRHRKDPGNSLGREVPVPISSPPLRGESGQIEVYLQMQPGETRVLRTFADKTVDGPAWPITEPSGEPVVVAGQWSVEFTEGGPVLPQPFTTRELKCWTEIGDPQAERFAGAARHTIQVDLPETNADGWFLDLGDVRESARVWVNGRPAGIVVAHPFRLDLSGLLKPGRNELAVEVTNLSANRIRDLDKRGVDWKKFYEINFVDHMYKPFDSSGWDPKPSGLLGPVTLTPYRILGSGE